MNRLEKFILFVFLLLVTSIHAQVGVGTRTPNSDAMLEVSATNKGLLLPRVALSSTTSAAPLSAHVAGMSVFNTATVGDLTPGYYYNDGSKWLRVSSGTIADATTTASGKIKLAGDLAGTADVPTVPGLALKVDKVSGKDLSTNDFTTAEKNKLAAISGDNTGDQDLSTYATITYADTKVADAITDAVITSAPSQNAVFDALALKAPLNNPAFTGKATIGTTTPNASAILEMESTTKGMLVPRMNSEQRDAITNPANALLIWNTSNNSFEVYKNTCACWVGINDQGNTPAANLVNTAPTALNLNYVGNPIVGQMLTFNFDYYDAQNDPEGFTNIQWQYSPSNSGNGTNIGGATNGTYTPTASLAGQYVRATVIPRATAGVLNGIQYNGAWLFVEVATIPTATNFTVSGTPALGNAITTAYTFSGGNNVEDTNPASGSTYTWQTASDNFGTGITLAPLYTNPGYTNNYVAQSNILGRYIRAGVRAKDTGGLQATNFVYSPWVGPITTSMEQPPVLNDLTISQAPAVGLTISNSYSYSDINSDPEGATTFQWYLADDANGTNGTAIAGATNSTYTVITSDVNKYLGVKVTPVALSGTLTGLPVTVYNPNAILQQATFTFTGAAIKQLPFFASNRIMNDQNSIDVQINVTQTGGIEFSTETTNGYSFNKNFTTSQLGDQWVTISARGTKGLYNNSGDNFTITGVGTEIKTKSINIFNNKTGSEQTTAFNGVEYFSNQSACVSSIISADHTSASCTGSITTAAGNSYNLILLSGQCWMTSNLRETPTAPCADPIGTGCNTILPYVDNGQWAYLNGATAPPLLTSGLLYQWIAAMNNTTYERSKGVCPTGWHIPSDCEFMYLEHMQGLSLTNQRVSNNYRSSTGEGTKLRTGGSSGFNSIAQGYRNEVGGYVDGTVNSIIWSSTAFDATKAWMRGILNSNVGIRRTADPKWLGFGVRCLKD